MKIVLSIVMALFVIGCSEEAPKEVKTVDTETIKIVEEKSTLEKVSEVKDSVVAEVSEVKEEVATAVTTAAASAKESTTEAVNIVKEEATAIVATVEEKVEAITEPKIDGALLYNKCAGCHGGMAERSALGKSVIISKWSEKQIEDALLGYKAGTYGRTMKVMMQNQVKNLSDAEIKALAKYIAK